LPIWFLFAEFFCAGAFFLLDTAFRRCIPGSFIPGMLMPGILFMSCFVAVCFLRFAFLFFRDVAFALALGFDLLIPGMLDISCCARAGTLATNRQAENSSAHTLTRDAELNVLILFIITPLKEFLTKEDSRKGLFSSEQNDLVV
jgi:hypothetical protein